MKLNYKRTVFVGFAFFLITAFWQAYDAIVPLILTNHYGLAQDWSGFVMSLDNILALFMLPLFGALSDKIFTKWGKRTPFVFVGTILAVVAFISLSFVDNPQLDRVENTEVEMNYDSADDLAENVFEFSSYIDDEKSELAKIFKSEYTALTKLYEADRIPDQYAAADEFRTATYSLVKHAKSESNKELVKLAEDQLDILDDLFEEIEDSTFEITKNNVGGLVGFTVVLLLVLIAMATFRSPAVALMPDVTVKPLRSKGNAIINLMGTAGAIIVLVFGIVFSTKQVFMSYSWYIVAVCAVMIGGLVAFVCTVKENKWAQEMIDDSKKYGIVDETEEKDGGSRKLSRGELTSLILILASVALWYIGYNSITSKYSVYATRELGFDYNLTLIIAQAAAVRKAESTPWSLTDLP